MTACFFAGQVVFLVVLFKSPYNVLGSPKKFFVGSNWIKKLNWAIFKGGRFYGVHHAVQMTCYVIFILWIGTIRAICFALPLSETNIFFYLRICVAAIFFVGLKCSFIGTNLGSMQLCDHFYYIFSQRRNDQKTELWRCFFYGIHHAGEIT